MATLTLGLQNLRRQINEAFPGRSTRSDGWIGDAAHRARTSGHNPDDTAGSRPAWNGDADRTAEVRAWDCTADFGPGVDAQDVVDHLRKLPGLSAVIRYIIFDGWWYHVRNGFGKEPYRGGNPHTGHVHFEGAWTEASDRNTTYNYRLEMVPVALTATDKTWLAGQIKTAVRDTVKDLITEDETVRTQLRILPWLQEVGRSGRSAHDTLFSDMRAEIQAVAAPDKA